MFGAPEKEILIFGVWGKKILIFDAQKILIFGAPEAPTKGGGTLLLAKTLPNPLKKPWFWGGAEGAASRRAESWTP